MRPFRATLAFLLCFLCSFPALAQNVIVVVVDGAR
jgi:hypothetical protein